MQSLHAVLDCGNKAGVGIEIENVINKEASEPFTEIIQNVFEFTQSPFIEILGNESKMHHRFEMFLAGSMGGCLGQAAVMRHKGGVQPLDAAEINQTDTQVIRDDEIAWIGIGMDHIQSLEALNKDCVEPPGHQIFCCLIRIVIQPLI